MGIGRGLVGVECVWILGLCVWNGMLVDAG